MVDPEAYLLLLKDRPGEVELLCEEMIPRVTSFFRDQEVFSALQKNVFPQLLADRSGGTPMRIWVPGCASGEEVYSIAICLLEFLKGAATELPIQIFGTDLSPRAIQKARQGIYAEKIAQHVSRERLQNFFVKRDDGYHVSSRVRELCIFAHHDLISDPPYSKLDLISCRNVLIYLDSIQTRIIPVFHYALRPAGFLVLGRMETARRFSNLFAPLDKSPQIYSKKAAARHPAGSWGAVNRVPAAKTKATNNFWEDSDLQKRADRAVLAKYAPDGVVVNENWHVVQVRGHVSTWLEPAPGKMSVNVLAMAKRSGLALDVAAALDEAKSGNLPVRRENLMVPHESRPVNLQVIPLGSGGDEPRLFLVLFEKVPKAELLKTEASETESPISSSALLNLHQELVATRERLVTMLDAHQQYTDETQSAQEESLSNLEEVQSFNEELETAKEELQSTNEELQSTNEELSTVNEELQTRNADLQQARDFVAAIVETVRQPLVVLDNAFCIQKANRAFYQTFHLSEQETKGHVIYDLTQRIWDVPELRTLLNQEPLEKQALGEFELEAEFPRVGRKILTINVQRLSGIDMTLMSIADITSRREGEIDSQRTQDELRQGQKMEAIGRLAGGVAHDFNNILTVILGFSELLMEGVEPTSNAFLRAAEIRRAGERAAMLTHQLLAFSRHQVLRPQVLDLNSVILEMNQILHRLVGDDIALSTTLDPQLWAVHADPGQMSQMVLNLALNARDAMQRGGSLTIETANTIVEGGTEPVLGLAPGEYVSLTVTDSGTGMDEETQGHIFEPFYTTKPLGFGTGLGLATVFGIVEQSGGRIQCRSEVGHGSTFRVDFPRVEECPSIGAPLGHGEVPEGTETVLVVEDEDQVRGLAAEILKRQGYTVLEAREASEGLEFCRSHPGRIDLLLTDVVMPGAVNGRELAAEAVSIQKEMRVVLMSGYTSDALVLDGLDHGGMFLRKPFTLQQLTRKVREVLDARPAAGIGTGLPI
jgi:two-component system CheB/CheR fusion protein